MHWGFRLQGETSEEVSCQQNHNLVGEWGFAVKGVSKSVWLRLSGHINVDAQITKPDKKEIQTVREKKWVEYWTEWPQQICWQTIDKWLS
jgi:hypothetical protein